VLQFLSTEITPNPAWLSKLWWKLGVLAMPLFAVSMAIGQLLIWNPGRTFSIPTPFSPSNNFATVWVKTRRTQPWSLTPWTSCIRSRWMRFAWSPAIAITHASPHAFAKAASWSSELASNPRHGRSFRLAMCLFIRRTLKNAKCKGAKQLKSNRLWRSLPLQS